MRSLSELNIMIIIRILGFLLLIEGAFMFTGIPFSITQCNENCYSLLISGAITAFSGTIMWFFTRKHANKNLGKREGYIIVALTWVIISLFGTLPFLISGTIPKFTDAFFETISGFTTTGATILTDIESLPKGILFWRSMTHWIGGMGIIVLTVAILPVLGIGGMQLYTAEMPGPTKEKLHPRITQTAKRLWGIYVLFTILQTLLLMLGGMDLFDSLCHTFGTVATGGFSTQNASIAGYSPYIQYVIIIFMVLAGTNFTLHYLSLHGRLRKLWENEEYRYYILIMLFTGIILTVFLALLDDKPFEAAFRIAVFQVVSIVTTTGYITDDYLLWPKFLWFIVFLLMFIGGMAGSTGGGMKVIRQLLLFKNSSVELKRLIHPQAIIPVRLSGKVVPQDIIFKIMAFFLLYMLIFAFGTLVMSFTGLDFETAIGSTAATLGNIGPGIGMVGPAGNYSEITIAGKWFLAFLMLLGRLELFTILILFSPAFWKK
ncbi:MAG: potassium transporter TrkG [Bacteroidales bacterium]